MSHYQPDDFDPPLEESCEAYDEAQQRIIDAMSEAEWNAALAAGRKPKGWAA
jgi:hypothetical protein